MRILINTLLLFFLLISKLSFGQFEKESTLLDSGIPYIFDEIPVKSVCFEERVYLSWTNVDTIASFYIINRTDPLTGEKKIISILKTDGGIPKDVKILYCCKDPEPCGSYMDYEIEQYDTQYGLLAKSERRIRITCEFSYSDDRSRIYFIKK